jgi:two-component system, chemotaxis family, CheB/CheR fusion protein
MAQEDDGQLNELLDYIREQRGIDFSAYKSASLRRRLNKRINAVGVDGYAEYLDYVQASPDEFQPLVDTLFINVTQFFRDADAWDTLAGQILPRIIEARAPGEPIRIWCAGIASGEEAYTTAILFAEQLGMDQFRERVKIYATDLDEGELTAARMAVYGEKQLDNVPAPLRERYFERVQGGWVFRNDLRRALIFGRHNLLEDAPISRLDLLVCRNTLIYFNRDAQSRVLARFHFALRDDGLLFLGRAEMLLTRRNLFTPIHARSRIFAKQVQLTQRDRLAVLTLAGNDNQSDHDAIGQLQHLRDVAFDHSPVPQIIIDTNGGLALANEAARAQFGISNNDLGRPFQDLEVSFRPLELRSHIEQVYAEQKAAVVHGVERALSGRTTTLDVMVVPVSNPAGSLIGVSVAFLDVTGERELRAQLEQTRNELETAYEELQSINEELETTNEELQSTNEELETMNEELQSTNEELETLNEELQSSNQEIRAINVELREPSDIVARLNAYMRSILNSVRPGVIVLDEKLQIHIWNQRAMELWGLHQGEVEGVALLNLDIGLPVDRLRGALRRALRGERDDEVIYVKAHNRRGKEIECRVTCGPLLGPNNDISGVILFTEDWQEAARTQE